MTQLNHQHREVKERLKEERRRTEELKRMKSDLDEERRLQNSTVEELQKEVREGGGEREGLGHRSLRRTLCFYAEERKILSTSTLLIATLQCCWVFK